MKNITVSKIATFCPQNGINVEIKSNSYLSKRLKRAFFKLPLGDYIVHFYSRYATIFQRVNGESIVIKDVRVKNK